MADFLQVISARLRVVTGTELPLLQGPFARGGPAVAELPQFENRHSPCDLEEVMGKRGRHPSPIHAGISH